MRSHELLTEGDSSGRGGTGSPMTQRNCRNSQQRLLFLRFCELGQVFDDLTGYFLNSQRNHSVHRLGIYTVATLSGLYKSMYTLQTTNAGHLLITQWEVVQATHPILTGIAAAMDLHAQGDNCT